MLTEVNAANVSSCCVEKVDDEVKRGAPHINSNLKDEIQEL